MKGKISEDPRKSWCNPEQNGNQTSSSVKYPVPILSGLAHTRGCQLSQKPANPLCSSTWSRGRSPSAHRHLDPALDPEMKPSQE